MFPSSSAVPGLRAAPRRPIAKSVARAALGLALLAGFAGPAAGQATVQSVIGRAVSDDTHNADVESAIARFRERDFDGARVILERIHSENPKLPPSGVMMATLWLSVNQVPAARLELDRTAALTPDDPEAYLLLADLAFQERRVTDSAVLFDRAAELTAAFDANAKRKRDFLIRSHAGQAAVDEARERWEDARAEILQWVEIDPDSANARQRLGTVLFRLDRIDEALENFREAKKLDPALRQPELLLASLHDQAKQPDKARELVEKAVEAAGGEVAVRVNAANWFLVHGDTAKARENAEAALEIDPKSLEGRLVLGTIARVTRDFDTALRCFEEAHNQSPRNYPASESLALVLAESEAKDDLQRAVELAETNFAMVKENQQLQVAAASTLAWVYYKLGRMADSERILAQIAQNNALTADSAYYVARILVDKGEKEQARRILEQVMANDPVFANRVVAEELLASLRASLPEEPPAEPAGEPALEPAAPAPPTGK